MDEKLIRINNMLLSEDEELRALGRTLLKNTSIRKPIAKAVLFMNSNNPIMIKYGEHVFLSQPRKLSNLLELLELFALHGWSSRVRDSLIIIHNRYAATKKLSGYFEEPNILTKFTEIHRESCRHNRRPGHGYGYDLD